MNKIDICDTQRNNLIAAAAGLQQCTKTDGTEVLMPGTDKRILIGNDAYLARVAAPASADNPSTAGASVRDALRRSQADTDYHGKILFTQAQFAHFVSMIAAPVAQSTAGAARGGYTLAKQFGYPEIKPIATSALNPSEVRARFEIGPMPVERDENGWWLHPGIPNFDEDHKSFSAWVKAVGLEVKYKCLESYPEHPLYDAWFERGECDASSWEPEAPNGEGWFTFSIHDSEDGPVWVWARRALRTASKEGGAA
jgi:hypothetical protein